MVEALLDEEPDDAVGVEEEVAAAGVLVPYDGVQGLQLRRLGQREDGGRERRGRGLGGGRVLADHHVNKVVSEKMQ